VKRGTNHGLVRIGGMLLLIVAAGILMLGCGKSGSETKQETQTGQAAQESQAPPETTSSTSSAADVTIDLVAHNIAFDKGTITVPTGAHVTINFDNEDEGIPHNFALYKTSAATDELFDGEIITGVKQIKYTFTAPTTPGDYFFRCDVHPERMTGTFVVE
jgi:plastocyanin